MGMGARRSALNGGTPPFPLPLDRRAHEAATSGARDPRHVAPLRTEKGVSVEAVTVSFTGRARFTI